MNLTLDELSDLATKALAGLVVEPEGQLVLAALLQERGWTCVKRTKQEG